MYECFVCLVCLCAMCKPDAHRRQQTAELKFQRVMSCMPVGAGKQTSVLGESNQCS